MREQEFYELVKIAFAEIMKLNPNDVLINRVVKPNDTFLYGLTVKNEVSGISPQIYLNGYLKEYRDGKGFEEILHDVVSTYEEAKGSCKVSPDLDFNFDKIKDHLAVHVVDVNLNKERLDELANTPIGNDLAVTYSIVFQEDETGRMSTPIKKDFAEMNGYDIKQIHEAAMKSMEEKNPAIIRDMQQMMFEMMGGMPAENTMVDENLADNLGNDSEMYVVTTESSIFGASAFFYPGVQENIANFLEGDFYMLPSSCHEVIVVPKEKGMSPKELGRIVKEANDNIVSRDEILSDKVYAYSKDKQELTIAYDPARERHREEAR